MPAVVVPAKPAPLNVGAVVKEALTALIVALAIVLTPRPVPRKRTVAPEWRAKLAAVGSSLRGELGVIVIVERPAPAVRALVIFSTLLPVALPLIVIVALLSVTLLARVLVP